MEKSIYYQGLDFTGFCDSQECMTEYKRLKLKTYLYHKRKSLFDIQMLKQVVKYNNNSNKHSYSAYHAPGTTPSPSAFIDLSLRTTFEGRYCYLLTIEETEGHRGQTTCPRSNGYPNRGSAIQTHAIWLISNYSFLFPTTIIITDSATANITTMNTSYL